MYRSDILESTGVLFDRFGKLTNPADMIVTMGANIILSATCTCQIKTDTRHVKRFDAGNGNMAIAVIQSSRFRPMSWAMYTLNA